MRFNFYIALAFLKSKKDRLFISKLLLISILTISLAIMVPIIILSIVNGFHQEIKSKVLANNFQIKLNHKYDNFKNYQQVLNELKKHPEVQLAVPFFEREGLIRKQNDNQLFPVTIKAFYNDFFMENKLFNKHFKILDPKDYPFLLPSFYLKNSIESSTYEKKYNKLDHLLEDKKNIRNSNNIKNRFFKVRNINNIIIGDALCNWLQTYVGNYIKLFIPSGDLTDFNNNNFKTLNISDLYSANYAKYNKKLVFIHMDAIEKIFQFNNFPTDIGINLSKNASYEKIKKIIRNNYPEIIITNIFREGIFKDFSKEKKIMLILLLFLVLSAFITIYISIHVLVIDKRKDIGILKTFGVKNNSIQFIFMFKGFIVSLIGIFFGVLFGILITVSLNEIIRFIEISINHLIFFIIKYFKTDFLIYDVFGYDPPYIPFEIMNTQVFYLKTFPYELNYTDIFILCIGAIFISIIAGYLPSKKAASQKTVESLKMQV